MNLHTYSVGSPFPGPVPLQEGAVLEMTAGGPVMLIQAPGLTRAELQAFKKSFKRYAYWQPVDIPVPIAVWVFAFPAPLNPMDVNFDARAADRRHVDAFLEPENGRVKNAMVIHLFDGPILRANKMVGLDSAAVRLFHETIRAQLAAGYSRADYDRYLSALFSYSTAEMMAMGTAFKHR